VGEITGGCVMAKHKYIATAEKMWELFCDYRKEVKENPIQTVEQSKMPQRLTGEMTKNMKPAMIKKFMQQTIAMPLQRPLTLEGFENYCADEGVIEDIGDYFKNKDGRYEEYASVCTRIRSVIRQDQIEGGMAGIYNPSITQRLNGLVEKKDITSDGESIIPKIVVQNENTANEINKLINGRKE
jgi:hypothetical protein